MTKTRFRAILYFLAAFLSPFAASLEKAEKPKEFVIAVLASAGTACIALRAYADQTPSQDGEEKEPTIHG